MDLCNRSDIQALLARHGFHFSKSMGQNFLIESWVPAQIADASGADAGMGVLEIGPGIGPLTQQLAQRSGRVVSVELDRRLLPVLAETMAGFDNFTLVEGDAMKMDLRALTAEHFAGLRPILCANLPYNITTPFLTACVQAGCFESLTVLIQKEVAERICAAPGTAAFGAFSLLMQYYTEPELLFTVLHPCAEGDLRRHPLPDAQDAARRRPVGDDALAHGACGLCPAAQDAGEQPADGLPTAEGAAN